MWLCPHCCTQALPAGVEGKSQGNGKHLVPAQAGNPHPHRHPKRWDHQEKPSALCVSTKGLLERAWNVANTQVTAPWGHFTGQESFPHHPSPPSGSAHSHQTHIISPKSSTDQPQPCSLRQQLHFPQPWEGAKPGTEGQHSPGSHPAAAATDSNNEMAALSTTLNKCHTLFLA